MSARQITNEAIVADHPMLGRVVLVLPTIPDDAPALIQEGIARRRLAAITGSCPCGAHLGYDDRRAEVRHVGRCPAISETLVAAIRRWVA